MSFLRAYVSFQNNYTCWSDHYTTPKIMQVRVHPEDLNRFKETWGIDKNDHYRPYRRLYHMERTRNILLSSEIRCDGANLDLELRGDGMWDFNDNQSKNPDVFRFNVDRRYTRGEVLEEIPYYPVLGGFLYTFPKKSDPLVVRDKWRVTLEGRPKEDH